jgi:S-adenosylmethionine uptake transporter
MACFTLNDTFVKASGAGMPLFQILFLRGVIATTLIFALAQHRGAFRNAVSGRDWGLIALRSVSEVAAAYFFVTALLNMPLANIPAILQVLPLTVTLGAMLLFKAPVGWRRLSAIMVGFGGMLLIVRPGPEGFTLWSLYALISVVCVTCRDLATSRLSASVPSMLVTFSASFSVLVFSAIASLWTEWVPVTVQGGLLVSMAAVFIVGGYYLSVQVMRVGDVSFVAPFRYTGLIWALILGWAVFGHWPAPLTMIGAAIIVGTGLFTLYRERQMLSPARR